MLCITSNHGTISRNERTEHTEDKETKEKKGNTVAAREREAGKNTLEEKKRKRKEI